MKSKVFRFKSTGVPAWVGFAKTIEEAESLLESKAAYGLIKDNGMCFFPAGQKSVADKWNRPIVTPQIV